MSFGSGSLTIDARRCGTRTVLERVRYDGISRCSRAFSRGDAALVMLSQLGPGVVHGDAVTTDGRVRAGAHLIVTNQAATRLMGGAREARARATWFVEDGGLLELIGEPLIAAADARYAAVQAITLGGGASVTVSELAAVPAGASVRLRTSVRRLGRELFYDAFDAAAAAPLAVGTFAVVGIDDERVDPLVAALDSVAESRVDVRSGVGALPSGAFARILGSDLWSVRAALIAFGDAARNARLDAATGR